MSDEHLPEIDRRHFTRVALTLPVHLHQGGTGWQVSLVNLSLHGLALTQPGDWDADYSHPFTISIPVAGAELELVAYLTGVEGEHLEFQMEHLDEAQLQQLCGLLEAEVDPATIAEELAVLRALQATAQD